jgi:hypothetical protein
MTQTPFRLETARLRTGAAYELVVYDRLREDERVLFAELAADPELYGVLRPTTSGAGASYKTADRDTALLLLTLAEPGPLPAFARGPDAERGLVELILDGVLEVEHDGHFVGGAQAAPLLASPATVADHPLGRLSRRALSLAAALRSDDLPRLAAFLYDFNRQPADPDLARRLPDREAVLGHLGLGRGTPRRSAAERSWEVTEEEGSGWIYFRTRGRRGRADGAAYKLYLSPRLEHLPQAAEDLLEVLAGQRDAAFKVGGDAAGVLRPDKLVAYFGDLETLLATARDLEERTGSLAPQGVPFTAPVDPRGLLSWGVDPPATARPLSWQGPESWRTWLVERLAAALARAVAGGADDPCAFALARLGHEGVDTERWIPGAGLFRAA